MNFIKVVFITLAFLTSQPAFSGDSSKESYEKFVEEKMLLLSNKFRGRQVDVVRAQIRALREQPVSVTIQHDVLCDTIAQINNGHIPLSIAGTTKEELIEFQKQKFHYEGGLIFKSLDRVSSGRDINRIRERILNLKSTCPESK